MRRIKVLVRIENGLGVVLAVDGRMIEGLEVIIENIDILSRETFRVAGDDVSSVGLENIETNEDGLPVLLA